MKRSTFLASAGACVASTGMRGAALAAETGISLPTPTGTIFGTLALPAKMPAPVVLIVAGSGPVDRNGNAGAMLQTNAYALLAAALAQRGVASVRYDKRGVGASAKALTSENDVRIETYANDVAAWVRQLNADKRFSRTIVAGHSEGSLLGILALQHVTAGAFVSLEGAGRPAGVVLDEQLKRNVPPDLDKKAEAVVAQLEQGKAVADPPPELAALFRPSVQPFIISYLKYDPANEIAKLSLPVTIVQGTADVQVTMDDANALKAGDPSAKLVVVQGMNHLLKHPPDQSIDPHVVDAIVAASQ
ncbi:MAG TPA: alpha/beta fold hydrolase [Candidatus Baltobacteraceae bacterium]|nr:alpha/beta fold hydrolase [Candidatus Baltobacteraceae bacterium]